ncbi:unnamed protein product [Notodromas monacha]|uniref:Vacuolar protein sorting-associated protein 51 homolog n=1 Tax=Notodromas monacha TaxID=399045 RepID=A0A7R9GG17_9CRUS|nr:unnamed protein product [Notodromas monacha]CAG0919717.1 unnamed protein product [Notodromas monacha]
MEGLLLNEAFVRSPVNASETLAIRELSLHQLMDREKEVFKGIQALDSEMQTLVYENYNKFIVASDTICKMKEDFKQMESEMKRLSSKMGEITSASSAVSSALRDRSAQIYKLSDTKTMLKKLQFLFDLPKELSARVAAGEYGEAIECYLKAKPILDAYSSLDSFSGICADANATVKDLEVHLVSACMDEKATPVDLKKLCSQLIKLEQDPVQVADLFLDAAKAGQLSISMSELEAQLTEAEKCNNAEDLDASNPFLPNEDSDFLQFQPFVELACTSFLSEVCITVASFNDVFIDPYRHQGPDQIACEKLKIFVDALMKRYLLCVEKRAAIEARRDPKGSCDILVEGLDRFHRRLQGLSQLVPGTDFGRLGMDFVLRVALLRCEQVSESVCQDFLRKLRHACTDVTQMNGSSNLSVLMGKIMKHIGDSLKRALEGLLVFVGQSALFAGQPYFLQPFCSKGVREGVAVKFFVSITDEVMGDLLNPDTGKCSPVALLLLSRLCLELEKSTVHYFLNFVEEKFPISAKTYQMSYAELSGKLKKAAQTFLNRFVYVQGCELSQMVCLSISARDWLRCGEPRSVRPAMKRIVEELSGMETLVGMLYEDGPAGKDRSSESSRRTYYSYLAGSGSNARRGNYSVGPPAPGRLGSTWGGASDLEHSFLTNLHKLFSDRIEVYAETEWNRAGIMTGVIKITLKTFFEYIRLQTFGKFGLQQIQVDAHYLQLYLWRFVADENLLRMLLDEVVTSAYHRCVEPALMENSIVEAICHQAG